MKKNDMAKVLVLLVLSFVMGGVVLVAVLKWTPLLDEVLKTGNTTITKNGTQVYEKSSLAASVEKIYDAVVVIEAYKNDELASTGTGFVYKTDEKYGYLLTNQHVISDMEDIKVINTSDETVDAKILGSDEYLDLAVLRIDKSHVKQVATIGDSEKMALGDTVFTVGSPMGYDYRGSVTAGILSGKDRMVSVSISNSNSNDWIMRVLQIDASINPGNSGGPLLNVNGEVIGICSLKLVDDDIEGMGFAIPIEYAISHTTSLEKGEKIQWPLLGISMVNVTDKTNLYDSNITIEDNIKSGVVVVDVAANTGADKAGIKKGDVITKINNTKVKDTAYLRYELYQYQAGDEITITLIRNGKEKEVKVTLTENTNK